MFYAVTFTPLPRGAVPRGYELFVFVLDIAPHGKLPFCALVSLN